MGHRSFRIFELSKHAPDSVVEAAVQACVDAFDGDRFVATCFLGGYDGHIKEPSQLPALNRALVKAGVVGGKVFVARSIDRSHGDGSADETTTSSNFENGPIVGTAVWFPPGSRFLDSTEQKEAGWNEFFDGLDSTAKTWWSYFFTIDPVFDNYYRTKAWWLNWIGVRKDYQRRGIGSALITRAREEALADRHAKPENLRLCLNTNTPEDVEFYESNGFVVHGTRQLIGPEVFGEEEFGLYSCLNQLKKEED